MWKLVNDNDLAGLKAWVQQSPEIVHVRAADGRGPLFWAYENGRTDIIDMLLDHGVRKDEPDAQGILPHEL